MVRSESSRALGLAKEKVSMFVDLRVTCESCGTAFRVNRYDGGKVAKCFRCDSKFLLPIPCPEQLIDFAKSKTWQRLAKLVDSGLLEGHSDQVHSQVLERIAEGKAADARQRAIERKNRREQRQREFIESAAECSFEELNQIVESGILIRFCQRTRDQFTELHHRSREQAIAKQHLTEFGRPMLSPRQERRAVLHRKADRHKRLVRAINELSPGEFEEYIAELYRMQGYEAKVSGGPNDKGIDVLIYERGKLWAIAQCKRYELENKVGLSEILKFVGSFRYARKEFEPNPVRGFIFTTSSYSQKARDMASNFAWLKLFSGYQIMRHAELLVAAVVD